MSDAMKGRGSAGPAANVRLPMNTDNYHGKELQRNPGIHESRFLAFSLPSRVGNNLVYPKVRS
jgi:hypothetical protein